MTHIAYYISSHGYGHAARQQAIIKHLAAHDVHIHVRSATPQKFYKAAASYHQQRYDIGMIQASALEMNIEASLQWMADFLADEEAALIEQELAFIRHQNIKLIVSDMPPIACEIAQRAGLPVVVITHFTWDWVYAHYTADFPQYQYIVDHLSAQYHHTTLALQMQLPFPHPFEMFPHVEPIGLVYNQTTQSRDQIREAFAIPDALPMVLLSMGGHKWGSANLEALIAMEDAVFLVMPDAWEQVKHAPERFRQVPMEYDDYHNLIAATDLIVGKAGGSTVAEVIGHQTPMIYTTQPAAQWREVTLLADTLETQAAARYVPIEGFMQGAWVAHLSHLLNKKHHWPSVNRNGAQQATDAILAML